MEMKLLFFVAHLFLLFYKYFLGDIKKQQIWEKILMDICGFKDQISLNNLC